jgi:hypothetical protein
MLSQSHDGTFGVIWLNWAFLWGLFFVLLALKKDAIGRYTGAVAAIQGIVTAPIPAFLLLTGNWAQHTKWYATALAIFAVLVVGALYPQLRVSTPARTDQSTLDTANSGVRSDSIS